MMSNPTDPNDLAKKLDSLNLDPDVAKIIANLEEQDAKFSKETKMLREMGQRQRDKIGELKEKLAATEAELAATEAELDASKCTTEEYRVELDRLERHVDIDLLEENEVLKAQVEALTKDPDIKMQEALDDLRPVCAYWAAGDCRYREKCKYGRHPAQTTEATASTTDTQNIAGDLELQSAK